MPRGQHRLMVAARSLAISTTLEQRAARLFFDRALRFVMRHPPLLSVGPTGRIADRHRGGGHPPTPATPPCVRVRTRRFETVTLALLEQGRKTTRTEVRVR